MEIQIPDEASLGNAINLIQQLNAKANGVELAPSVDQYYALLTTALLPYVETRLRSGSLTNFLNNCNTEMQADFVVTCYYESVDLSTYEHNQLLYYQLLDNFRLAYTTAANFKSTSRKVLSVSPLVEIFNPINITNLQTINKPLNSNDWYFAFELSFSAKISIQDCNEDC
jgi:hypothetical protein